MDIGSDRFQCLRADLDLVVIDEDVVEVLKDESVADVGKGKDPGDKEAHFLEFSAQQSGHRVSEVEIEGDFINLFVAEFFENCLDFSECIRAITMDFYCGPVVGRSQNCLDKRRCILALRRGFLRVERRFFPILQLLKIISTNSPVMIRGIQGDVRRIGDRQKAVGYRFPL